MRPGEAPPDSKAEPPSRTRKPTRPEGVAVRHQRACDVRGRAPTRLTVGEAAEEWLRAAGTGVVRTRSGELYKPSALRTYTHAFDKHLLPRSRQRPAQTHSRKYVPQAQRLLVKRTASSHLAWSGGWRNGPCEPGHVVARRESARTLAAADEDCWRGRGPGDREAERAEPLLAPAVGKAYYEKSRVDCSPHESLSSGLHQNGLGRHPSKLLDGECCTGEGAARVAAAVGRS
jgi:hypothetical protein